MDYKQKYEEALGWMQSLYNGLHGKTKEEAEHFFPELKESEDERIRNALLDYFGECKKININPVNDVQNKTILDWLEKQGEKLPANKVEPKFKVGDWVIYEYGEYSATLQIKNIVDGTYEFTNNFTLNVVDEYTLRLWTIQDAKDGDVLSFNDGHGNDSIELIKSVTDKKIEFWFCLTNGNRYEVFDGIIPYTNFASRESATPATKEQRNILFQKMKESGYEWDDEKKELKKIEQRPIFKIGNTLRKVSTGDIVTISEIDTENKEYRLTNTGFIPFEYENLWQLVEKNPTVWSEEDETFTRDAVAAAEEYYTKGCGQEELVVWLKSLKDRVQPQSNQEWGEYDKIQLSEAIQMIEANGTWIRSEDAVKKVSNWLKSLKPQNRWNPSEEQLRVLQTAIKDYGICVEKNVLESLYNDLKKF